VNAADKDQSGTSECARLRPCQAPPALMVAARARPCSAPACARAQPSVLSCVPTLVLVCVCVRVCACVRQQSTRQSCCPRWRSGRRICQPPIGRPRGRQPASRQRAVYCELEVWNRNDPPAQAQTQAWSTAWRFLSAASCVIYYAFGCRSGGHNQLADVPASICLELPSSVYCLCVVLVVARRACARASRVCYRGVGMRVCVWCVCACVSPQWEYLAFGRGANLVTFSCSIRS
jgi:hypothetical protein